MCVPAWADHIQAAAVGRCLVACWAVALKATACWLDGWRMMKEGGSMHGRHGFAVRYTTSILCVVLVWQTACLPGVGWCVKAPSFAPVELHSCWWCVYRACMCAQLCWHNSQLGCSAGLASCSPNTQQHEIEKTSTLFTASRGLSCIFSKCVQHLWLCRDLQARVQGAGCCRLVV